MNCVFILLPRELINSVLTNSISSDLFQKVFGDVVEGSGLKTKGQASEDVLIQETRLCVSRDVTIYPTAARNKDNKWRFVLNQGNYVQGFTINRCLNEGSACPFSEGNPLGYESVCRQEHVLRKLLVLKEDGGGGAIVVETFKLPACCVCYIKSNYDRGHMGTKSSASKTPALSDNGFSGSSPDRGSQAQHNEINDSPVASADRVPSASEKKAPHLSPPPVSNSSVAVATRRCHKAKIHRHHE